MSEGLLNNKKILCHINNMGRGGAERVMSVLIDNMIENGTEVVLVTVDRAQDEYSVDDKVKRIEIDNDLKATNPIVRFAKRMLKLRRIIEEQKPDIVLSFCSKENFRCSLAMRGMKIPLVVSVRSNPKEHYSSRILKASLAQRIDGCVFQSQDAKEYFSSKIQDKSCVIINPIDKEYFDAKLENEKADKEEIRIVTAGRISKPKNHIHMIKSFISIAEDCPKAHLYIYGKDDKDGCSDIINAEIAKCSCKDRIHIMGPCINWPEEIVKADIFVMSSIFEGMPNALLEAMVVGLPVISTDCPCGGPAAVIEDGVNGRLVPMNEIEPLAQAMKELINDKQKRISFGENAMKIRKDVETQAVCNMWKEYLASLIK